MAHDRRLVCRRGDCGDRATMAGLCEMHAAEEILARKNRDMAVNLLHEGEVGGRSPDDPVLREELWELQKWWSRACSSVNYGRCDDTLLDEAEYAVEWCIRLAQQIGLAELALRSGEAVPASLEFTREWVWQRFANLEAGLKSNGVDRNE